MQKYVYINPIAKLTRKWCCFDVCSLNSSLLTRFFLHFDAQRNLVDFQHHSWTKQHWGDQGNQLFANKPRNPRSCSVLHISQCSEHRLMWLRSPSKRSTKSSLRPFGLRTMETKNTINTMQTVSIIFCNI